MTGTPACADHHSLTRGGAGDDSVVMDERRVKGHAIDIESDRGELDTQGQMMPLTVTHLGGTVKEDMTERDTTAYIVTSAAHTVINNKAKSFHQQSP